MTYFKPPLETDPDTLLEAAFERLRAAWPNWEPNEANQEVILAAAVAVWAAENRDVASDVPDEILRVVGRSLHGVAPIEAANASADSTWTMIDNQGYTIPAGTQVGIPITGDELAAFEVVDDVVVPPGQLGTAAGEVVLQAIEPGEATNDLNGAPQLINPLFEFVDAIALAAPTSGGIEAESDSDYLNRLTARLQLLSPRPILPRDFAVLATDVAGVHRSTAIDGFNPTGPLVDQERTVSVVVVDEAGEALSAAVKAEVAALLEAEREVNFLVFVIDPTYTTFDITYTAVALPGFDPAEVQAAADAALAAYLDPATWGTPRGGDPISAGTWALETTVRYLELAEVLQRVAGLDYITNLTFARQGDPQAQANVLMAGAAPLPRIGVVNGNVTAP